ncbi:lysis protein [Salmonella enterica subsp. enterica]|nr:lysis protein [Salmonella enterica subsp. enterica serovar Abaetetuba]
MVRMTTQASYSVSSATILYSILDRFTHDEWYAIGIATGVIFGLITMVANIYFQRQRNQIMRQKGERNETTDQS